MLEFDNQVCEVFNAERSPEELRTTEMKIYVLKYILLCLKGFGRDDDWILQPDQHRQAEQEIRGLILQYKYPDSVFVSSKVLAQNPGLGDENQRAVGQIEEVKEEESKEANIEAGLLDKMKQVIFRF